MTTGAKIWDRSVSLNFRHSAFLSYARGTAFLTGAYGDREMYYDVEAFDPASGDSLWTCKAYSGYTNNYPARPYGDHSNDVVHPVIAGDILYLVPFHHGIAIDITTGKEVSWNYNRDGHGCSSAIAAGDHLFWRGTNLILYDIGEDKRYRLTTATRPGCRISYVPAGGMLNIPESSAGCSCEYAVQTSLGFLTNSRLTAPVENVAVRSGEKPGSQAAGPQLYISAGKNISVMVSDVSFGRRLNLRVADVSGRNVYQAHEISNGLTHTFTWNYSGSLNGVYIVELKTARHSVSKKLLLAH